jgi:hypothetical protein
MRRPCSFARIEVSEAAKGRPALLTCASHSGGLSDAAKRHESTQAPGSSRRRLSGATGKRGGVRGSKAGSLIHAGRGSVVLVGGGGLSRSLRLICWPSYSTPPSRHRPAGARRDAAARASPALSSTRPNRTTAISSAERRASRPEVNRGTDLNLGLPAVVPPRAQRPFPNPVPPASARSSSRLAVRMAAMTESAKEVARSLSDERRVGMRDRVPNGRWLRT